MKPKKSSQIQRCTWVNIITLSLKNRYNVFLANRVARGVPFCVLDLIFHTGTINRLYPSLTPSIGYAHSGSPLYLRECKNFLLFRGSAAAVPMACCGIATATRGSAWHVVAAHGICHGIPWNDCEGKPYGKRPGNPPGTPQQASRQLTRPTTHHGNVHGIPWRPTVRPNGKLHGKAHGSIHGNIHGKLYGRPQGTIYGKAHGNLHT